MGQGRNDPRVRGEEWLCDGNCVDCEESPPRARGRGDIDDGIGLILGITTACAGKSTCPSRSGRSFWNHPRVRGEEVPRHALMIAALESPPRARGRVIPGCGCCRAAGITPACAGKSWSAMACNAVGRNHPRVRGEELCSPLAGRLVGGITPACAGKRTVAGPDSRLSRNHPRVRGEEAYPVLLPLAFLENHPRVRGEERVREFSATGLNGITPACAGKSTAARRGFRSTRESPPRARGRAAAIRVLSVPSVESPPRARGRVRACRAVKTRHGITPACAGKSLVAVVASLPFTESPPRARGRDGLARGFQTVHGITPACAGKRVMKMRPPRIWSYPLSANFSLFFQEPPSSAA